MIMENFQISSVCLVCSINADSVEDSNFNSEICSKFLRFVSRYLSYDHSNINNNKIHQFLTTVKAPRFSTIQCCDICVEQLNKFLAVYEGFELIQLELFNILDRISTLILKSCSENKPKEISDFQVALTNLVEEKRTKHLPVVKIKKLKTDNIKNESINVSKNDMGEPVSVNHLKRELSPLEDDHTDFEDLNLDSNFEISSQKHLPESLGNENEITPITLKIVNIKIDNDEHRRDPEEEIASSKDRRSYNHQKLARRLPPKLTKRRVQDKSKYTCLFCSESHPTRFNLFRHLHSHIEERPYHCKQCPQEFSYRYGLRGHVNRDHGNRSEPVKDKPCPICGKLFSLNSSVLTHISFIHSKVKNFKCEHENCLKAFVTRSDLIRHQKGHTDLKSFKCNICDKLFKRRVELVKHKLFIHSDETEKKKMCSVCGKVFAEMRMLRIHRARMHPDVFKDDKESLIKFKCPRAPCDMKFLSRYDVKKHIHVRHKHDRINLVNI